MNKVSVVVPNYNHAPYLPMRLDSILSQTFGDFELIILDDASTDESRDVIAPYLRDRRVRFCPNEVNSGSPFIQWNRGVGLAKNEFVWLAESDDFAAAEFLATLVPMLEQHPRVGLAYCQSWRTDEKGNITGTMEESTADTFPGRWSSSYINSGRHECANYMLWKNTIPNASAVLFRKAVYTRAGGAPVDLRICGDWMTWARMLLESDITFTSECLNYFRHHQRSVRETIGTHRFYEEKWKVESEILRRCEVSQRYRRVLALQVCREHFVCLRIDSKWQHKWELLKKVQTFVRFVSIAPLTVLQAYLSRESNR